MSVSYGATLPPVGVLVVYCPQFMCAELHFQGYILYIFYFHEMHQEIQRNSMHTAAAHHFVVTQYYAVPPFDICLSCFKCLLQ